jgi:hypothetical protein
MAGEKDPFRAAEAQAKQQQHEREEAQPGGGDDQQQPSSADYQAYDEEVGEKVEGISGASAGGPAV